MGDSQFPALSLDNNPWMKYFSPTPGVDAGVSELSVKARAPGAPVSTMSPPAPVAATSIPPVMRSQSGKLTRHTSAPNRLSTPPVAVAGPDRSSGSGDSRRGKAEAPVGDSAPAPQASSAPRLQKKPSNPLLQKQKMFASKSMNTQSAPSLTAAMREMALQDAAGRSIESELSQQSLYKTELCRSFEETGSCRYGAKCQFAHGRAELRPVIRHPKYKTEVCKTWQAHGSCPYGTRCRFIHGDGSLLVPSSSQLASSPPSAGLLAPTPLTPAAAAAVSASGAEVSSAIPIAGADGRNPVAPSSQSSSPAPRLAIFADIIGESSAQ